MNAPHKRPQPRGFQAFAIILIGQLFSLIGTGMTRFALTLFAWEKTEQATSIALLWVFAFFPMIMMSPLSGALVDRWNRKLTMMLSDLGAGAMTILLFLLSLSGQLEMWHLYLLAFITGIFESFQFPAYSSAISTMVNKDQYARASALQGVAESSSGILAPIFAASLYGIIGLNGILIIDILTFSFAIGALVWVHIPQPPPSQEDTAHTSLWEDSLFGFRYIWQRPSLFGLQMIFFFGNLLFGAASLQAPMILARTNSNEAVLGLVNAVAGVGGVIGGIIISWVGVPQRKILGVVWGWILPSAFGLILVGMGQHPIVWVIGGFGMALAFPLVNASNQAIWMSKIPPALQGRVFSIRRLIAQIAGPIATFLSGVLADNVFEPNMSAGGAWASTFAPFVGTGKGAGMGLIMVIAGSLVIVTTLMIYARPFVRHVESIIPDYEPSLAGEASNQQI